jgi:hypothetical protein
MIKAKPKSIDDLFSMIKKFSNILFAGCGGCTSVCLAGGQRETIALSEDIRDLYKRNSVKVKTDAFVIERQCNSEFLTDIEDMIKEYDCVVSLACGAGVQYLAEQYPSTPVFPGLDTMFIGVDLNIGLYQERCRSCGNCRLGYTGGICPVTCCAKSLLNGPCGGTNLDGSCEVGKDKSCAWNDIYERLKAQNRLDDILGLHPVMEWTDKGPGIFIQDGFEKRYK